MSLITNQNTVAASNAMTAATRSRIFELEADLAKAEREAGAQARMRRLAESRNEDLTDELRVAERALEDEEMNALGIQDDLTYYLGLTEDLQGTVTILEADLDEARAGARLDAETIDSLLAEIDELRGVDPK